jgi:hypothetical protein
MDMDTLYPFLPAYGFAHSNIPSMRAMPSVAGKPQSQLGHHYGETAGALGYHALW